ncbi:MAG: helix-turn-helix domain-containing protein [Clostridia bacterium]|nr:helix-turn-helix domain-containing protein [Clostridia bacterium]
MNNFFILSDALDYIESNLKSEMSQQEIADHCRCSLSSLQKLFRYAFHIGVSDYVTRRRLTCCARELISTSKSALNIAMDWGYNSPEVFTRAFTRVWGESPAAFRKKRRFSGLFPKFEIPKNEKGVFDMTELHRKYVISELYDYLTANRSAYLIGFDIKHLVPINEISNKAGDIAIRDSLKRIEEAAEENMLLFRIGGDEFVLATGSADPKVADAIIEKVLSRNEEAFEWEGKKIPLSLYAVKFLIPDRSIRYGELFTEIHQTLNSVKYD